MGVDSSACSSWPGPLATPFTARAAGPPQERARVEIAEAEASLARGHAGGRGRAPGLQPRAGARLPAGRARTPSAVPLRGGVPPGRRVRSPTRGARSGGSGPGEQGDASFIFVEGDVSLQRAGRSTFEPARQRQPLFDGDFVKAGKTGSAEIMFYDGTLYTIRPGSLFECRRPASAEATRQPDQDGLRRRQRLHVERRRRRSTPTRRPRPIDRDSRVSVDVAPGDKTEVTSFRGRTTVSTGKETVVLEGREKVEAAARDAGPLGEGHAAGLAPAGPPGRQPDLRPEDRRPGRPEVVQGARRGALPPPDLALAALRPGRDRGGSRRPRADPGPRQGLAGRAPTSGGSRRSTRTGWPPDWSFVRRFKMLRRARASRAAGDGAPPELYRVRAAADGQPLPHLREDRAAGRS